LYVSDTGAENQPENDSADLEKHDRHRPKEYMEHLDKLLNSGEDLYERESTKIAQEIP